MFPEPLAGATANLPIYKAKLLGLYISMAVKETTCCRKLFIDSLMDIDVDVPLKKVVVIILWCVKSLSTLGLVLVLNLSGPDVVLLWSWSWFSVVLSWSGLQLFLLFWSR